MRASVADSLEVQAARRIDVRQQRSARTRNAKECEVGREVKLTRRSEAPAADESGRLAEAASQRCKHHCSNQGGKNRERETSADPACSAGDPLQRIRQLRRRRIPAIERNDCPFDHGPQWRVHLRRLDRPPAIARQQMKQDHARAEDICLRSCGATGTNLRCEVHRCAEQRALPQRRLGCRAHIGQHDTPVVADNHVLRFDVAVHDAGGMQNGKRRADVANDSGSACWWKRSVLLDEGAQRPSAEQFHDDDRLIDVLIDVVDANDRGVVHAREAACLAEGSGADSSRRNDFQRHLAFEPAVPGAVDTTEGSFTDEFANFESVGEGLVEDSAGRTRRIRHPCDGSNNAKLVEDHAIVRVQAGPAGGIQRCAAADRSNGAFERVVLICHAPSPRQGA